MLLPCVILRIKEAATSSTPKPITYGTVNSSPVAPAASASESTTSTCSRVSFTAKVTSKESGGLTQFGSYLFF
ncbi:hypothetical protein AAC03nite_19600 [Alicyclobacillus acidoterrestris]|nr:hypothetical protein AAC03nite_19600 [Alicyclobacillus acidoterrestris]